MLPDLWFDVYPYNNPQAGARLVRLTSQQLLAGSLFRVERRGTGSGRIVLNSGQAEFTAANLHEENLVEVGDANVSATDPLGGFFLHRGDLEIISADEQGGEDFPIGGPGLLAYLAREIMWSRTYLTTGGAMDPFDDLWRLSNQGLWAGGRKLGAFAWRAVTECLAFQAGAYTHRHGDGLTYTDTHPDEDRLSSAISLLTMDFDQDTDSAGHAWTPYEGEFGARVKQQLLGVILELVGKGMDVQMRGGRQLILSAYNSYGRDFRGTAFGAGVVRFAHGVNIANPARRAIEAGLNGSRALVGSNDVYARADAPGGYHVVRSIGLDSDAEETAGLVVDGEANLRAREAGSDVPALKVLYGDDPDNGRYLFAPPEVGGHAWVGDLVTIHRGTGAFQWNNADARIEAITFELTADKLWDDPTVEFGAVYRSADERGRAAEVQAIAGRPHGPHIRLCDAGLACELLTEGHLTAGLAANGDAENGAGGQWSGGAYQTAFARSGTQSYGLLSGTDFDYVYTWDPAQVFEAGVRQVVDIWGKQGGGSVSHEIRFGVPGVDEQIGALHQMEVDGGWVRNRFCWTPSADRTGVRFRWVEQQSPSDIFLVEDLALWTTTNDELAGRHGRAARCDHGHRARDIRLSGAELGLAADNVQAGFLEHITDHPSGSLAVAEADGSPDVSDVVRIEVAGGLTLADDGSGQVTITGPSAPLGAGFHGVLVQRTTDFAATNSNDANPDFDTELYDTDSLWTVSSPKILGPLPASYDGKMIRLGAWVGFHSLAGGFVETKIYKNVTPGSISTTNDDKLVPGGVAQITPNTNNTWIAHVTAPFMAAEGDTFTIALKTGSGTQTALAYNLASILFGLEVVEPGSGGDVTEEDVRDAGRWEVVVSGTAPPVAVSTPDDDDWVYAWVST